MFRALVFAAAATLTAATQTVEAAASQPQSPRIEAYADEHVWNCMPTNPSCAHDHWSIERNEVQEDTSVTYAAIGTRFTTERRFEEAVNLVWQWSEGKMLLRQAN